MADGAVKKADDRQAAGIGCLVLLALASLLGWCAFRDAPDESAAEQAQRVSTWADAVESATRPCDQSMAALGAAMEDAGSSRGDLVEGYRIAARAEENCGASFGAISRLAPPEGLNAALDKQVAEAKDRCGDAAFARKQAAEAVAAVFNGDGSVAAIAQVEDSVRAGAGGVMLCAGGLASLRAAANVTTSAEQ